jgi:hypothetical protein
LARRRQENGKKPGRPISQLFNKAMAAMALRLTQ